MFGRCRVAIPLSRSFRSARWSCGRVRLPLSSDCVCRQLLATKGGTMKKVAGTFLAGLIAIATNADAGPSSFVCTPIGVQADANLAAIRCSNPSHTLPVFFYGTERNSALAEDVRQLGIAALT